MEFHNVNTKKVFQELVSHVLSFYIEMWPKWREQVNNGPSHDLEFILY